LVKDDNGDLLAGSDNIWNKTNYFCQSLNVHSVSDVRQICSWTISAGSQSFWGWNCHYEVEEV
jgi:hypothetical protein